MDVRMPDGTLVQGVPDGITQSELLRRYNASKQPAEETAGAEDPGFAASMGIGAGRTLDRLAAGLRQATPGPVRNAIDWANNKLGMGAPPSIDPATQAAHTRAFEGLAQKQPLGTFLGEVAPAVTTGNPFALAGLGGLEYGTPAERTLNASAGLVGGTVGQLVGKGAARVMGPASGAADIPLSVGQSTQARPAQIVESVLANLPGSSGVMARAHDRTFSGFNRAIAKTFGEDATALTPELMGAAKKRAGGTIGDIAERNAMKFDDPLFNDLVRISERAKTELTPEQGNMVVKWIDNIVRDVGPQQTIAGKTYKAYDSKLGALSKQNSGTLADVFGDLRHSLRNAMDKSITKEDAAAWAKARKEYLNLKTVSEVTKYGRDDISPTQLLSAVNQAQKNARFGSGNDLAELAQWAKKTLPDKIPNSGTAQRLFYQKLLTSPLSTLGAVGGLGYGANQVGLGSEVALGVPLAYLAARGMAGKPASKSTEELLKRLGATGGGLLGLTFDQ